MDDKTCSDETKRDWTSTALGDDEDHAALGLRWMQRWTPDGCDLAPKQQQVETGQGRSCNLDLRGL